MQASIRSNTWKTYSLLLSFLSSDVCVSVWWQRPPSKPWEPSPYYCAGRIKCTTEARYTPPLNAPS